MTAPSPAAVEEVLVVLRQQLERVRAFATASGGEVPFLHAQTRIGDAIDDLELAKMVVGGYQ
jgi:hypothetical protein